MAQIGRVPEHRLLRVGDTPDEVILQFRGTIGWYLDAQSFSSAMDEAEAYYGRCVAEVHSPGGSVYDGWAMYNRFSASRIDTVTRCVGVAASMASIFMMSGKRIEMAEASIMMIHEPWCYTYGNQQDLRKQADELGRVSKIMRKQYAKRTKLAGAEIAAMMAAETWLSPDEALEKGFCDAVTDGGDPSAQATFGTMGKKELFAWVQREQAEAEEAQRQKTEPNLPVSGGAFNKPQNIMDIKLLAVQLGLPAAATQDEVLNRLGTIVTENAGLKASLGIAEASLKKMQAAADVARDQSIATMVSTALTEGRITAAETEAFTELGKHNAGLLQTILASKPTAKQIVPGTFTGAASERSEWKLADWMAKDPAGLERIHDTDPAQYAAITARG